MDVASNLEITKGDGKIKDISKAYGMAGARVGYAMAERIL